jgi:hypothetical protein
MRTKFNGWIEKEDWLNSELEQLNSVDGRIFGLEVTTYGNGDNAIVDMDFKINGTIMELLTTRTRKYEFKINKHEK